MVVNGWLSGREELFLWRRKRRVRQSLRHIREGCETDVIVPQILLLLEVPPEGVELLPFVSMLPYLGRALPVPGISGKSTNPSQKGVVGRHCRRRVFEIPRRLPQISTDGALIAGIERPITAGGVGAAVGMGGPCPRDDMVARITTTHLERLKKFQSVVSINMT